MGRARVSATLDFFRCVVSLLGYLFYRVLRIFEIGGACLGNLVVEYD